MIEVYDSNRIIQVPVAVNCDDEEELSLRFLLHRVINPFPELLAGLEVRNVLAR